ncbi:TPM domain-containing protein [Bradyrhizobium sp. SYSU BS000235]|uniref:TPM domain-containing protein n=1 Tax=Bradyrhizobium sp. SYSU BS000235 TaxID=3411332 RepID=UPI003C737579
MSIQRIGRHLIPYRWSVRRAFPRDALANIETAIEVSEKDHTGQIRFVVEGALDGRPLFRDQPARARAIDVFSQLRVWDTDKNSGILIYLLLADRDVEIVADRGIDAKVNQSEWEAICRVMEAELRSRNFEGGVLAGIAAVTKLLMKHFPASGPHPNELPDKPVVV